MLDDTTEEEDDSRELMPLSPPPTQDLSHARALVYGLGHIYNDLCASMWFTYLLIFIKMVLDIPAKYAGMLMLIGQVVDGTATPIVGWAIDHDILPLWLLKRFGSRNSWHLIGTILVSISFPFIFNKCFICADPTAQLLPFFELTTCMSSPSSL